MAETAYNRFQRANRSIRRWCFSCNLSILIAATSTSTCRSFSAERGSTRIAPINGVEVLFLVNNRGETEPCGCPKKPIGGLPRLGGYLAKVRSENKRLFLFDVGDRFTQLPKEFPLKPLNPDAAKGAALIQAIDRRLMFSAIGLGDLDLAVLGVGHFKELTSATPVVATNLIDTQTARSPIAPYRLVRQQDVTVVVTSILEQTEWLTDKILADQSLRLTPAIDALREQLVSLPTHDLLIVLAHTTKTLAKEIARQFPQVDLILLGAEGRLERPESVNNALIVSNDGLGRRISHLTIDRRTLANRQWLSIAEAERLPVERKMLARRAETLRKQAAATSNEAMKRNLQRALDSLQLEQERISHRLRGLQNGHIRRYDFLVEPLDSRFPDDVSIRQLIGDGKRSMSSIPSLSVPLAPHPEAKISEFSAACPKDDVCGIK